MTLVFQTCNFPRLYTAGPRTASDIGVLQGQGPGELGLTRVLIPGIPRVEVGVLSGA